MQDEEALWENRQSDDSTIPADFGSTTAAAASTPMPKLEPLHVLSGSSDLPTNNVAPGPQIKQEPNLHGFSTSSVRNALLV
jgi:hypothetical protein